MKGQKAVVAHSSHSQLHLKSWSGKERRHGAVLDQPAVRILQSTKHSLEVVHLPSFKVDTSLVKKEKKENTHETSASTTTAATKGRYGLEK